MSNTTDKPDHADIEQAVERLRQSAEFARAPQLVRFLEFVVDETLAGRSERIKAYAIGTLALGRPDTFDPGNDSIVRVEANRLRKTLEDYYRGIGAHDPIVIAIPTGGYVPEFRRADRSRREELRHPHQFVARRILVPATITLTFAFLVLVWITYSRRNVDATGTMPATVQQSSVTDATVPKRFDRLPRLRVDALVARSPDVAAIASDVTDRLRFAIGRFDELKILAPGTARDEPAMGGDPLENYLLRGNVVLEDGEVRISLELVDQFSHRILWVNDIKLDVGDSARIRLFARDSAVLVANSYGLVATQERTTYAPVSSANGYYCILSFLEMKRHGSGPLDRGTEHCMEQTVLADPAFSLGWSYFGMVRAIRGLDTPASDPVRLAFLDEAYAAARRAIGADPSSARAQLAFARALHARGEMANAILVARKALSLNPDDPVVQAELGVYLVNGGESEEAQRLLDAACWAVPDRPEWFDFYSFVAHLMNADQAGAIYRASRTFSNEYDLGLVARAIAAKLVGHDNEAQKFLSILTSRDVRWSSAPGDMLAARGLIGAAGDRVRTAFLSAISQ